MSSEEVAPSTTAGESAVPVATNTMSPQELAATNGSTTQAWASWGRGARTNASRWTARNPTGALDSAAVSFRYMPKEYNWFEVLWSLGVLYGFFIVLPVGAGLWSLHRIGSIVGWW